MARRPARCYRYCKNKVSILYLFFGSFIDGYEQQKVKIGEGRGIVRDKENRPGGRGRRSIGMNNPAGLRIQWHNFLFFAEDGLTDIL